MPINEVIRLNEPKMIKKIAKRLFFPGVTVAVLGAVPAQAAVFNATFLSVVDNTDFGTPLVDNVSEGDAFEITIALDNGGTSLLNQTWTASDVVSVTFDFGNGAHTTVFDPNGGNGLNSSTGDFVTNGLGQLIAVPSSWTDSSQVNVVSTNSSQTPNAWFINANNDVYYTNDFNFAAGLPNLAGDAIVASNWTVEAAEVASTPEPGTILGLLAVGSITALTRKRKA